MIAPSSNSKNASSERSKDATSNGSAQPASELIKSDHIKTDLGSGVTKDRTPALGLADKVPHPELPRANTAPSKENPNPPSTGKLSVLQAHFAYWDPDHDGLIYPNDIYTGFHKIGFNWFMSILAVFVVSGGFSYFTQDSWIPDPLFSIKLKNAHRCKHGSDSESYDAEGRFLPVKFEEVFSKHATNKDYLTLNDIFRMIVANRNLMDFFGWFATFLEWGALYWVAATDDGKLTKERARASYDGSLWPLLEEEQKNKKLQAKAGKSQRKVFKSQ